MAERERERERESLFYEDFGLTLCYNSLTIKAQKREEMEITRILCCSFFFVELVPKASWELIVDVFFSSA